MHFRKEQPIVDTAYLHPDLPGALLIQLQRVTCVDEVAMKDSSRVRFSTVLDMGPYIRRPPTGTGRVLYDLAGVLCHPYGTATSGHFDLFIRALGDFHATFIFSIILCARAKEIFIPKGH